MTTVAVPDPITKVRRLQIIAIHRPTSRPSRRPPKTITDKLHRRCSYSVNARRISISTRCTRCSNGCNAAARVVSLIADCRHFCITSYTGWMCVRGSRLNLPLWHTVVTMARPLSSEVAPRLRLRSANRHQLAVDSTPTAVGLLWSPVRRSGTLFPMYSEIRNVIMRAITTFVVDTSVTSALAVF